MLNQLILITLSCYSPFLLAQESLAVEIDSDSNQAMQICVDNQSTSKPRKVESNEAEIKSPRPQGKTFALPEGCSDDKTDSVFSFLDKPGNIYHQVLMDLLEV